MIFAEPSQWNATWFDKIWNSATHQMTFRNPFTFSPYELKAGYFTYGGSDYWENDILQDFTLGNSPVFLDSTQADSNFDIITSMENRRGLFFEIDLFRTNLLRYIINQNFMDVQFGLGYRMSTMLSNPNLPEGWTDMASDGTTYRFRPFIQDANVNTSIAIQWWEWMHPYVYHSIGYSWASLYESIGGEKYLNGTGVNESFAIGIKILNRSITHTYAFTYGVEAKWNRTRLNVIDDPKSISPITGVDMYGFGVYLTFGATFGGRRTIGDDAYSHMLKGDYVTASKDFESYLHGYPNHAREKKAKKYLDLCYSQMPYQYFEQALVKIDENDYDSAVDLFNKAMQTQDSDLKFEIQSRKNDMALILLDSVSLHIENLPFNFAESLIVNARKLSPNLFQLADEVLAQLLLRKGDVLFKGGNYVSALEQFNIALELDPSLREIFIVKTNKIVEGLLRDVNQVTDSSGIQLALVSLKYIIELKPERLDEFQPLIDELTLKLDKKEHIELTDRIHHLLQKRKQKFSNTQPIQKIELGNTYYEVEQIIGYPDSIDENNKYGHHYELWTYTNAPFSRLYFEDHLLVKVE